MEVYVHPLVKEWMTEQGNRCSEPYHQDCNGRFLTPFDKVVIGYATDQGPELFIRGTVACFEGPDHVAIKTDAKAREYKCYAVVKVRNRYVIRMPEAGPTQSALCDFFNSYNLRILNHLGNVTINGSPVLDRMQKGM